MRLFSFSGIRISAVLVKHLTYWDTFKGYLYFINVVFLPFYTFDLNSHVALRRLNGEKVGIKSFSNPANNKLLAQTPPVPNIF